MMHLIFKCVWCLALSSSKSRIIFHNEAFDQKLLQIYINEDKIVSLIVMTNLKIWSV